MITWLRDELDFWFGGRYRDDPEHARSMRSAWAKAANELGLRHIVGTDTFGDRIEGFLNGYQVDVTYVTNFDVQKPETNIRVRLSHGNQHLPMLDAEMLLRLYENNAGSRSELIAEEKAWLCGNRYGIGISGNEFELSYRQHYWMYEPSDVVFVCLAMVKTIRYVGPNMTKFQR